MNKNNIVQISVNKLTNENINNIYNRTSKQIIILNLVFCKNCFETKSCIIKTVSFYLTVTILKQISDFISCYFLCCTSINIEDIYFQTNLYLNRVWLNHFLLYFPIVTIHHKHCDIIHIISWKYSHHVSNKLWIVKFQSFKDRLMVGIFSK